MAKIKQTAKKTTDKKPITAERKKKEPFDRSQYWSTEEVAKKTRVTNAQVSHWKSKGIIHPAITGSKKEGDFYKPFETIYRLMMYYQDFSKDTVEMKDARERQLVNRARKEELDLAEREGELVNAEKIERAVGEVIIRLKINLLTIPKGIAPQIRDEKDINVIAAKIKERIEGALKETASININELLANLEYEE